MTEIETKEARLQDLMDRAELDAVVLSRVSSFAWMTGGGSSYINTASDIGAASLVYARDSKTAVTTNIEAARLAEEERLDVLGWEIIREPWYAPQTAVAELTRGMRVGADTALPGATDMSAHISHLRARLTPEEGDRFRELGRLCSAAMSEALRQVAPGQTEYEISALLAASAMRRGVWPIVDLVAVDERVFRYRHPIATSRRLDRYAMLVLCGRRLGLVCSITRLVHFGPLPEELRQKQEAVARVDAAFLASTQPGRRLSEVFDTAARKYAAVGYPNEWQKHHQGGAAGYEPREYLGTPEADEVVEVGQAFAWNPSITGVKSEDTILVAESGVEILTATPDLPTVTATCEGQTFARPAIMEI